MWSAACESTDRTIDGRTPCTCWRGGRSDDCCTPLTVGIEAIASTRALSDPWAGAALFAFLAAAYVDSAASVAFICDQC